MKIIYYIIIKVFNFKKKKRSHLIKLPKKKKNTSIGFTKFIRFVGTRHLIQNDHDHKYLDHKVTMIGLTNEIIPCCSYGFIII